MLDWFYGAIIRARNEFYEKEIFKSFSLDVPVVSIGNITVGGTGKTPLVALVAEILSEDGEKIAVLSRGYGRENAKQRVLVSDGEKILASAKQAGDEPFELARKLLGKSIIVADANRVAAGIWAREKFGITAFVLDDAFQHRRVKRDVDLVTIDASNPFGNGKLLPTGILREPLENLKRADAIVITRANLTENISKLSSRIREFNSGCPIFISKNKTSNISDLASFFETKTEISSAKVNFDLQKISALAFCALGNPNNFFDQLKSEKFNIISAEKFSDHHFYTQRDIFNLETKARKAKAEILLTTAKDAVKLQNLQFNLPCFVVESRMVFDEENQFRAWLTAQIDALK